MQQFTNGGQTTLSGSINNTSNPVTFTVASATTFPTSGNFTVKIDAEILLVTAVSGTSFTASRAQEGTTIASHSSGATVYQSLTAGSLKAIIGDFHLQDTLANRPAAGTVGKIYIPSDAPLLYRDTGSAWEAFGPFNKLVEPQLADFTWFNQGGATAVDTKGGILLSKTNQSSVDSVRGLVRSFSAPYTVEFGYFTLGRSVGSDFGLAGPVLYDTVSGKLYMVRFGSTDNQQTILTIQSFTNVTTSSGSVFSAVTYNWIRGLGGLYWFKIQDDGTTRRFFVGVHNNLWEEVFNEANTVFFTPNRIGICLNAYSANINLHLLHYKQY